MADEPRPGRETGRKDGLTNTTEARHGDAPDERPADTDPPQSRASLSLSRRGALASLLGVSGLSLVNEPASAVRGTFQSPTRTGRALDPQFTQTLTFSNPEPDRGDYFGASVAMSADGTTALVGAWGDQTGTCSEAGEAYVFRRTAEGWDASNSITLPNPDPSERDQFGYPVALSADGATALVDANKATYVFRKTAAGWDTNNPVTLSDPSDFPSQDVAVSADGTTALIGVRREETDAGMDVGAAYVFRRTDEGWNTDNPVMLSNPNPDHHDSFGTSVAVNADGTSALVGVPLDDTAAVENVGAAHLFEREAQSLVFENQTSAGKRLRSVMSADLIPMDLRSSTHEDKAGELLIPCP